MRGIAHTKPNQYLIKIHNSNTIPSLARNGQSKDTLPTHWEQNESPLINHTTTTDVYKITKKKPTQTWVLNLSNTPAKATLANAYRPPHALYACMSHSMNESQSKTSWVPSMHCLTQ